jgi:23S rRNA (adenine2503-C2)-methyltransferase
VYELNTVFLGFDQRLVTPLVNRLERMGNECNILSPSDLGASHPDVIVYGEVTNLAAIANARARFPYACIVAIGQMKLGAGNLAKLAELSVRWLDQGTSIVQIATTITNGLAGLGMNFETSGGRQPSESSLLHLAKQADGHGNGKNVFLVKRLNAAIESGFYWLSDPKRFSVCVSSGAGCILKVTGLTCKHCYTGICPFQGNLTTQEIVGQFVLTYEDAPTRHGYESRLSMMAQSEALLNLPEVIPAWHQLTRQYGRLPISFSTVGFLDPIRQLSEENLSGLDFSTIQITMPYGDEEQRQQLLPATTGENSAELTVPALLKFAKSKNRPLVYNVSMIGGPDPWQNNRPTDARKLAAFCRRFDPSLAHTIVKVSDYNGDGKGLSIRFRGGSKRSKHQYIRTLLDEGVTVRVGLTLGASKNAGCGEMLCRILPALPAR